MPPPAEGFVSRFLLGPALRTQPDGRLVALVREGYEAAFEEIVRRYRAPLRRYAAAIVGISAEDVTQDALSKAFLALRRDEREIELRPWLYRILRNTALNDLRDRPPRAAELADSVAGSPGVAEELERREEVDELIGRLHALPEAQRAAIVMRELEGLGHDEIAAALGISGGAARQAIHRARTALRDGLGMAIPLPLVRTLLEGGGAPATEIAAGGAGAGIALKAATATVLVAGTLGAGLTLHENAHDQGRPVQTIGDVEAAADSPRSNAVDSGTSGRGPGHAEGGDDGEDSPSHGGHRDGSDHSGDGSHRSEPHDRGDGERSGEQAGDPGPGGNRGSSGGSSGEDRPGGGDGTSGKDGGGPGPSGPPSGDGAPQGDEGTSGSGDGSGSNSGPGSGSQESGSGGESGSSRDSGGDDGFSRQMQSPTEEDR